MGCCSSKNKGKDKHKTVQTKKEAEQVNAIKETDENKVEVTVVNKLNLNEQKADEESKIATEEKKEVEIDIEKEKKEKGKKALDVLKKKVEVDKSQQEKLNQKKENALKLIQAKKDHLKSYLGMLFSNLDENTAKEEKTLAAIMKEIKEGHKEIDDHIEELKQNPTTDKAELAELINESQLVKKISHEHTIYKKNLKNYNGMRSEVLSVLRQIDANLGEMDFEEDEEEEQEEQEDGIQSAKKSRKSSSKKSRSMHPTEGAEEEVDEEEAYEASVRKGETPRSVISARSKLSQKSTRKSFHGERDVEFDQDEEVTDISERPVFQDARYQQPVEFDFGFKKEPMPKFDDEPRVISEYEREIDKEIAIQIEKEKNNAIFELENAVIKYNRLRDDFMSLRANHDKTKKEFSTVQAEISELKKVNNTVAYNNDALFVENQTFQYIKQNLIRENERIKDNFDEMRREISDLQVKADATVDIYQTEENNVRIQQLELQIQQRKDAVKELEDKYKALFQTFKGKVQEVQKEKATLYKTAADLDIEAITTGTHTTLPQSENPSLRARTPTRDIASKILTDSKITSTHNILERARDTRFDADLSNIQIEMKPTFKSNMYDDYHTSLSNFGNNYGVSDNTYVKDPYTGSLSQFPTTISSNNKLDKFRPSYDSQFAQSYLHRKEKENLQYNGRILL